MKEFKIRCSQIGQIMSASDKLIDGNKTYCETWLKEQLYDRKKEFTSKYTDKGLVVEDNSIDLVSGHLGIPLLLKNEQSFENDFLTGTPDIIEPDFIIDVKNSWDCFTFPLFETECPNKNYYWQAQGYLALTDKQHYKLIYVLSDTPEHLIEREAKYKVYEGYDYDEVYEELKAKHSYSDVNNKLRIKVFEIERNDTDIQRVYDKVKLCREFINQLKNNL